MTGSIADFAHLVEQWHPTRNGDLTPDQIRSSSRQKIWWKCSVADDHEWDAVAYSRTDGQGCPFCAGHRIATSNCLATTHPAIVAEWHPTKNGTLTPSDVGAGTGRRVWWQCPAADDHEWRAAVVHRTTPDRKTGCPFCAGQKITTSNCLAMTHVATAQQWHPAKNGSLTPLEIGAGSHRKIWWKCSVADDHEWEASVISRTRLSHGCPCCSGRKAVPSNCLAATHPKVAAEWHAAKNGSKTPADVTAGSGFKAWWRCSVADDHVWRASVCSRCVKKNGCPNCRQSKGEKAVTAYLSQRAIPHRSQWGQGRGGLPRSYRFDFAVDRQGEFWLIEFHGQQHYIPSHFGCKWRYAKYKIFVNTIRRDEIKVRWCRDRGKKLLVIPYWDYDRINEILDDFFAGKTPTISAEPDIVGWYEPMRQKIKNWLASRQQQGGNHENRNHQAAIAAA